MQKWLRQIALCFSAGTVGALAKIGIVWICARFASASLASHLASAQYPAGIYARMVWGGIAAFLFLLPFARGNWLVRGLLGGIVIAIVQIVGLPLLEHGSVHFALIPILSVLVMSCIWGLSAVLALRLFGA